MAYDVTQNTGVTPQSKFEQWASQYRDNHLEVNHDTTQYTAATPDESILVVGPPRLIDNRLGTTGYRVVGLVNSFNYSESAQLQPMKAIGSRRHIFSRTNAPVQGSIGRMVVDGPNMYRALYSLTDLGFDDHSNYAFDEADAGQWFANLEEDLFRMPIGLGIVYQSPSTVQDGRNIIGADYVECVHLQSRQMGVQSGQTMIFEQVSFMADRVVPFSGIGDVKAFTAS